MSSTKQASFYWDPQCHSPHFPLIPHWRRMRWRKRQLDSCPRPRRALCGVDRYHCRFHQFRHPSIRLPPCFSRLYYCCYYCCSPQKMIANQRGTIMLFFSILKTGKAKQLLSLVRPIQLKRQTHQEYWSKIAIEFMNFVSWFDYSSVLRLMSDALSTVALLFKCAGVRRQCLHESRRCNSENGKPTKDQKNQRFLFCFIMCFHFLQGRVKRGKTLHTNLIHVHVLNNNVEKCPPRFSVITVIQQTKLKKGILPHCTTATSSLPLMSPREILKLSTSKYVIRTAKLFIINNNKDRGRGKVEGGQNRTRRRRSARKCSTCQKLQSHRQDQEGNSNPK